MEIMPTDNLTVNSMNKGVDTVGQVNTSEKMGTVTEKTVAVNDSSKRSDLSGSIGGFLNNMADIGSITVQMNNQIETLNEIQSQVMQVKSGDITQEQAQPNIAKIITKFNEEADAINQKIESKNNDVEGESHTYFDGRFGSLPLDIENLDKTIVSKKEELSVNIQQASELSDSFKQQAQKVIESEITKAEESSPFKEINFGKESADFSANKMLSVVGSVVSAQANAIPAHSAKLLSV